MSAIKPIYPLSLRYESCTYWQLVVCSRSHNCAGEWLLTVQCVVI